MEDNTLNTFDIMLTKPLEEFIAYYSFKDTDQVYTNGSILIPVFRLRQWINYNIDLHHDTQKTPSELKK